MANAIDAHGFAFVIHWDVEFSVCVWVVGIGGARNSYKVSRAGFDSLTTYLKRVSVGSKHAGFITLSHRLDSCTRLGPIMSMVNILDF